VRAHFVIGHPEHLTELFSSASLADVQVTTQRGRASFPSAKAMVEAELRGWLPAMGVVLPEGQIGRILEEAEHVLVAYITPEGTIAFDMPAHFVTAIAL
jgi:hypothetical protein